MPCNLNHRYWDFFEALPDDQGGLGRHKCCGCAYELGYEAGSQLRTDINLDLNELPNSQAGTVRHKSPHAAFAQGYYDGVRQFYCQ